MKKPKWETVHYVDLIQVLDYIEANGHPKYHDRMWEWLVEHNIIQQNGAIRIFPESCGWSGQAAEDLKLFEDTVGKSKNTYGDIYVRIFW